MELEATIKYRSSNALFKIQKESEGIFTATLLRFNGGNTIAPPVRITLVRGIRNWTGSTDDEILLGELGKFIDNRWPLNEETEILGS